MSKTGDPEIIHGAMGAAVAAEAPADPVLDVQSSHSVADQEEIARLAYAYWVERGCPDGSPEEDWFRAETVLREQTHQAAA
jgi:hypothetical protein